jgi:hypothetical protein
MSPIDGFGLGVRWQNIAIPSLVAAVASVQAKKKKSICVCHGKTVGIVEFWRVLQCLSGAQKATIIGPNFLV